ncbi:MAG: nodulation protein NfeD [Betaproteobacteria bacterium]|nr:nodulation protein NfeD [Betaproteobacteria bacterium]MDH3436637.1 nodulation protein NfeD [Betaproteobacteria bacterium]
MPHNPWRWLRGTVVALCALWPALAGGAAAQPVVLLTLDGAVSPATADYMVRGIRQAADKGAGLVILQVDTPGGLDTSMRSVIKEILASPVPVAVFVGPSGARAASAGTFILYASHVAAMAPGTNLGAATPVPIGIGQPGKQPDKPPKDDAKKTESKDKDKDKEAEAPEGAMGRKQVHDAAAYIRSLAQLRGRNAEWGERAVREAVSLSAEDALKMNVADLLAQDVKDLLVKLHGRKVMVQGVERTLETKDAEVLAVEPDWRSRLLAVIANPSVALILMMLGIYGLIFEMMNPGFVLPGVIGGICLLLALYAFQLLPINYAGLGLILLGMAFIVAEAFLPSFGALGIGGVIALAIGAVILIDPAAGAEYTVPLPLVAVVSAIGGGIVFFTVLFALKARTRPVVSGQEQMIGSIGEVLEDLETEGWARVESERWRIVSTRPLRRGQKVKVMGVTGLTLRVEAEADDNSGRQA